MQGLTIWFLVATMCTTLCRLKLRSSDDIMKLESKTRDKDAQFNEDAQDSD
jgi:hypothetical protein